MSDEQDFNELEDPDVELDNVPKGDDDEGDGEEEKAPAASADSSEEEDDDAENEYEADGFVVDEEEEGEGEEGDSDKEEKKKKKKKKRRRDYQLDEEDYALLEDNQVVGVRRPAERKRLKKRGDETTAEKPMGAQQLKATLFGEDDLEDEIADLDDERGTAPGGGRATADPEEHDDYYADDVSDEMGDFIVDGDGDDEGASRARRRKKKQHYAAAGLNSRAMQEAASIFGNVDDLLDMYHAHKAVAGQGDDDVDADVDEDEAEQQPEDEEDYDDEETAAEKRSQKAAKARERKLKKAMAVLDPELVEAHHLAPTDQLIKETDAPERLQLLELGFKERWDEEITANHYKDAAKWVYDNLFGAASSSGRRVKSLVAQGVVEVQGLYQPSPGDEAEVFWPARLLKEAREDLDLRQDRALLESRGQYDQDRWANNPESQAALLNNIEAVLHQFFERQEEVPLVAMYRKEICGELLAMRASDEPSVTGSDGMDDGSELMRKRYKRGTIQPKHRRIRRWEVLWAIFDWGYKFWMMSKRRLLRLDNYNAVMDKCDDENVKDALADCLQDLIKADSMAGLDDVDAKFRVIILSQAEAGMSQLSLDDNTPSTGGAKPKPKFKMPQRGSTYKQYLSSGLQALARQMAITPKTLAEHLDAESAMNEPEDPRVRPEELVAEYMPQLIAPTQGATVLPGWDSVESVLAKVKDMMAMELAAEPAVRKAVRNLFYKSALVSTNPTEAGETTLDPFHRLGIVKRLRNKKLALFEGSDQWLRLHHAEKAGLIKVAMEVPPEVLEESVLQGLYDLYTNSFDSDLAKAWNALRKEVVRTAVVDKLFPQVKREVSSRLLADAKEYALGSCSDRFWDTVKRPPLRLMVADADVAPDEEPPILSAPRIMACCWGPGGDDDKTVIVQLDGTGSLIDLLHLGQLSGYVPRTVADRHGGDYDPANDPKKAKDAVRIRDKILTHFPNAILLGAGAPQCRQLHDDLTKIAQYTEQKHGKVIAQEVENKHIEVMWADEEVAALWANSAAAKSELPEHPPAVRKAVALGRMALDPLAVLASLCGREKEILSLRLHDMQDKINPDELMSAVEQTMITAVSQVGADINAMAAHSWRAPALQFVPGLGPRKAAQLLKAVQANENHVENRVELKEEDDAYTGQHMQHTTHILGRKVFTNSAPFLRIRAGEVKALANKDFDAQDDTRVHPEREVVLIHMCDETVGLPDVQKVIEEGREALLGLNLWDFAAAHSFTSRMPTIIDIHQELLAPYGELRLDGGVLTEEEVFLLLHNETSESLKVGRLVEARVIWVGEREAKVVIQPGGMEAVIPYDRIKSNVDVDLGRLGDYLQRDQQVVARIDWMGLEQREQEINPDDSAAYSGPRRYIVKLTTRSADLQDSQRWEEEYCKRREEHYHILTSEETKQNRDEARRAKQKQRQIVKRPIEHPLYKNETIQECTTRLKTEPVGSAAFRPVTSSTSQNPVRAITCISLTVKLFQGAMGSLFLHTEIREAPKSHRNVRLVTPLTIEVKGPKGVEAEKFEDLDEVIARYVEPMVANAQAVTEHRKFKDDSTPKIDELLLQQKAQLPTDYVLSLDYGCPGYGYIAFLLGGEHVHHETFSITHKGYLFRNMWHSDIEKVVARFKSDPNYKKKQQQAARTQLVGSVPGGGIAPVMGHNGGYAPVGMGGYPAAGGYPPQPTQGGYAQPGVEGYNAPPRGPFGGYGGGGYGPAPGAAAGPGPGSWGGAGGYPGANGAYGGYPANAGGYASQPQGYPAPPAQAGGYGGGGYAAMPGGPGFHQPGRGGGGYGAPPGGGHAAMGGGGGGVQGGYAPVQQPGGYPAMASQQIPNQQIPPYVGHNAGGYPPAPGGYVPPGRVQ